MRFFKERVEIEALMRSVAKATMQRDPRTILGEVLSGEVLSDSEKQELVVEVRIFEVAIHHFLLAELCANQLDQEKVSYLYGKSVAIAYASANNGNEEVALAETLQLLEKANSYLSSAIERKDARPIQNAPLTFYCCQEFVSRVQGGRDIIDLSPSITSRDEIFNVAKQSVRHAESFYSAIQKEYKITF